MRSYNKFNTGSALIMTIVLTVLLAIVGTVFLLMARTEKIATSARSDNEELKLAADSVIGQIQQVLAADVPGIDPNGAEYYDYPDDFDKWLANLEPENVGGYQWRHISDLYDDFGTFAYDVAAIIRDDYTKDINDANFANTDNLADADGDGVSDARWVKVPNLTTSKGKPVYAAVRIVDNGGMLNVNTAYLFDPTGANIDGSSQTQINLAALSQRGANGTPDTAAGKLQFWRCNYGAEPNILPLYQQRFIWPVDPNRIYKYAPFDISDELKLRNRYFLNYNAVTTRIEELWGNAYDGGLEVPRDTSVSGDDWFNRVNNVSPDPNIYDYRHISTTYNMDRVIDPHGRRMVWINNAGLDPNYLYMRLIESIDPNDPLKSQHEVDYAQLAVNIKDYRDNDANVSTLDANGKTHYGFERPFIYISELARNFVLQDANNPADPNSWAKSYAVELHMPPPSEPNFADWRLVVDGTPINIDANSFGGGQYYVARGEDPNATLPVSITADAQTISFDVNSTVKLIHVVNGVDLVVDYILAPGWLAAIDVNTEGFRSYQRDIRANRWIQRFWDPSGLVGNTTLGHSNSYTNDGNDPKPLQVFPVGMPFRNVGDVGLMFRKPVYYEDAGNVVPPADVIGYSDPMRREENIRINLADPNVQRIFRYITNFNPGNPAWGNDPNETRIKGRININTAPWFVLAQLPWLSQRNDPNYNPNYSLAKAIAGYRDRSTVVDANVTVLDYTAGRQNGTGLPYGLREFPGFASIGELTTVINNSGKNEYSMWYYGLDAANQSGRPDLTPDAVADDFEEQNLIFSRISDLVTVRSDVFTAYILVRLGKDGPQKRVMAILDRSETHSLTDPVRIVAFQQVPDAR